MPLPLPAPVQTAEGPPEKAPAEKIEIQRTGAKPAAAPTTETAEADGNLTDGCVESFSPDTDYFPDKVTFEHAKGVSVTW